MKRILFGLLCVLAWGWAGAQQGVNAWSTQDYDFYAGDFNGDGYTDILYVARNPSLPSGILLSDGTAPTLVGQTWASNYLGIPWSSGAYTVVVGDFNGDGKSDIFLQSNTPGDSYLLLTNGSGLITAISQTIPAQAMGIAWSADQHHLVTGDFNGAGRAGLFFQPTAPGGTSAVVFADENGQFTSAAPAQSWDDGYLGFNWSVIDANVYAGDFNGDGRADLLIQALPVHLDSMDGTPAYSYPANMNGVVLAQSGPKPVRLSGVQSWSRNGFGVDWSPLSNNLVIGDFNGDGRSDVLLQPLTAVGTASLLFGDPTGPIFSTSTGPLTSDVAISADAAVLVTGSFAGGRASGLLIQSTSREGTNSIARNIASGIHAARIAFPALSATSISMTGIGYPPGGSAAVSLSAGTAAPRAATMTPTSAGRTAGQFSVTPTGAATYNIPLWTPPGARGIEPHLALHYTSGGPDGPMGPGWSLTGMSAIVRCGKTWASSGGAPAGVVLSTTDDICLDGNRLRLTGGTQGVAGSTYQTEIADFSLVTAYGAQGNGPQYFIVQGKDGHYYEYGNTPDSQLYGSGATTPYGWALNKVRDRQSNNMTFTYTGGATALTLTKILFTATPGSGNAAPYEVDFNYVARAGGDTITQYVAGGSVTRTTQLDNVTVLSIQPTTSTVRKYQLGYSPSTTTNRPMLQTVQECGGGSGTDCIRPTTITYQSGSAGWITTANSVGQTIPSNAPVFPMDLNGDGITDLVYPQTGGSGYQWYVQYGSASGTFGAPVYTGVTTLVGDALFPADVAGRGHPDLLYPSGGVWWRLYWNGSALATASTGAPVNASFNSTPATIADVNGDGLPDLVWTQDGFIRSKILVQLNTTTPGGQVSFGPATVWYSFPRNVSCDSNNPCDEFHVVEVPYSGTSAIQVADFNGDGMADALVKLRQHTQNGDTYWWYQMLSTGAAFTSPSSWAITPGSPDPQLTNWNGDGCTDIVSASTITGPNWRVAFSSCTASGAGGSSLDTGIPATQPILIADWDGDGRLDLLTQNGSGTWKVARSTGNGVSALADTGIAVGNAAFFVGDFNGDGLSDLGSIDLGAGNALKVNYHNGYDTPPDLAISFSDGFGITFSPTYTPISQNNYSKYSDATFPDIDLQASMYVVSQFSASDGTGGTYTNDFWYYGAHLNLQGRGFEGFYAARQHDSRNGVYQYSYYQRSFPYIGSLFEQETVESDGATVMALTENSFTYTTLAGTNCSLRCFPYISSSTVYNYEPTGSKKGGSSAYTSYTTTNYTYDSYGNLTDTKAATTDTDSAAPASPFNGQSWITEIANTITNDTSANWCLGRPSTTTTTKTVPGQNAQTRTVSHTIDYANCRATVETVEPNDSRLKVTTSFGFDACGNTNSVSVVGLDQNGVAMPARGTTTNYSYATARCALPEAVTNALLNQTTVTAYNYNLGLPASTTDPNGIPISWLYDDFGRKTQETRPDGTYTTTTYTDCVASSCWGVSDLRFLAYSDVYSSAGTQLRQEDKFYDGLDRLRYDEGHRVLLSFA